MIGMPGGKTEVDGSMVQGILRNPARLDEIHRLLPVPIVNPDVTFCFSRVETDGAGISMKADISGGAFGLRTLPCRTRMAGPNRWGDPAGPMNGGRHAHSFAHSHHAPTREEMNRRLSQQRSIVSAAN